MSTAPLVLRHFHLREDHCSCGCGAVSRSVVNLRTGAVLVRAHHETNLLMPSILEGMEKGMRRKKETR